MTRSEDSESESESGSAVEWWRETERKVVKRRRERRRVGEIAILEYGENGASRRGEGLDVWDF